MTDPVNHPAHYVSHPSGVECIQVTQGMTFCLGNAVKYLWRHDEKGNAAQDLEKARWYVQHAITMCDNLEMTISGCTAQSELDAFTQWARHEPPSDVRAAIICIWDANRGTDVTRNLRSARRCIDTAIAGLGAAAL